MTVLCLEKILEVPDKNRRGTSSSELGVRSEVKSRNELGVPPTDNDLLTANPAATSGEVWWLPAAIACLRGLLCIARLILCRILPSIVEQESSHGAARPRLGWQIKDAEHG